MTGDLLKAIPQQHHAMVYEVLLRNMQPIKPGTLRLTPSLYDGRVPLRALHTDGT